MVEKLEAGKTYRWDPELFDPKIDKKNEHADILELDMKNITDGKPHKCLRIIETRDHDLAEFEGVPGGLWYWPLSGFVEVKEDGDENKTFV